MNIRIGRLSGWNAVRALALGLAVLAASAVSPLPADARGQGSGRSHSGKSKTDHPERTESVRGYRKKNGTYVQPYKRAPRGQGKKKKKGR